MLENRAENAHFPLCRHSLAHKELQVGPAEFGVTGQEPLTELPPTRLRTIEFSRFPVIACQQPSHLLKADRLEIRGDGIALVTFMAGD